MKRVEIESPFAGDVETNIEYARRCMADSLRRGEAPLASHLLYTQPGVLDDDIPAERELGMRAGKVWSEHAELVAVYVDRGITKGMRWGIDEARNRGIPVEFRSLEDMT